MSRDSGNTTGGIFSTEYSNKIILLLLGVLILFVFLDFQARRRSNSVAAQPGSGAALHPVLEPIRDKAEIVLGKSEAGGASIPGARPAAGTPARLVPNAPVPAPSREVYRNGPVLRPVETSAVEAESFYLYFLRFKGNRLKSSRTELVRVRRPLPEGEVTLVDILTVLQKGPLSGERGLLNAFDERIKITDAYADQGIAYVYLDKAVGRMGAHIIQDRLDQLTYTLTQFPEIQKVKLFVDGQPVQILGAAQFAVPALLQPGAREIGQYP